MSKRVYANPYPKEFWKQLLDGVQPVEQSG